MSFTPEQNAELNKPLDKRNVKPPAPGKYGDYVEGWHVIAEANRIFGFDGWTRETVEMREVRPPELVKASNGKETWRVGFVAKVRVTVHGVIREGTGFGSGANPDLGDSYESAVKEAETDAMKRALMTFGNPFGLALYDKTKANVTDNTDEELWKHRFALRDAPDKQSLKVAWENVPWALVNEQWKADLTAEKDARLTALNAPPVPPKANLDALEQALETAN